MNWKSLEKDPLVNAAERDIISNKIKNINRRLKGNDILEFKSAAEEICEVLIDPFIFHIDTIAKIYNMIASFASLVIKRPNISTPQDYQKILTAAFKIIHVFSDKMQASLEEFKQTDITLKKNMILDQFNSSIDVEKPFVRNITIEKVLSQRTSRISLVLDRCYDVHNIESVLRTAECLGIQNVWIVEPVEARGQLRDTPKGNISFLSIQRFQTSLECVEALKKEGRKIWVTDLSADALSLENHDKFIIPNKVALVIGRESDGCSEVFKENSDLRVYLPLHGFTESLNLGVATALILQKLFYVCPELRGDISEEEKEIVRSQWNSKEMVDQLSVAQIESNIDLNIDLKIDLNTSDTNNVSIAKRVRDENEETILSNLKKQKNQNDIEMEIL